jgi:hypothetical protein
MEDFIVLERITCFDELLVVTAQKRWKFEQHKKRWEKRYQCSYGNMEGFLGVFGGFKIMTNSPDGHIKENHNG